MFHVLEIIFKKSEFLFAENVSLFKGMGMAVK